MVKVAEMSAKNETIETATATAEQIKFEAAAVKSTISDVVNYQADAFKVMETEL